MKIYVRSSKGFAFPADADEVNNLIKSGELKYYDTHPYNDVVTKAECNDNELEIYGMYNGEETLIVSFDNIWEFYNHFDEEYKVLDL